MPCDNKKMFYSKDALLSRNSLFNFVNGARGTGKTFDYKKWALTSPYETVWVRRHNDDLSGRYGLLRNNAYAFWGDILEIEKDLDITDVLLEGNTLFVDGNPKIHFVALSTSRKLKSQSYHNVDKIIYDEYLVEERMGLGYLTGEIELFLGLYETVNRLRIDGRPEVRAFFLGNLSSFVNPYFNFFKINPFEGRFKSFMKGLITVEMYRNETFEDTKQKTRFGQLIEGTDIGEYIIKNKNWRDDFSNIRKRSPTSRLLYTIRIRDIYMGLWIDDTGINVSYDHNKNGVVYSRYFESTDNELPIAPDKQIFKTIRRAYEHGYMSYESLSLKQNIYDILKNIK